MVIKGRRRVGKSALVHRFAITQDAHRLFAFEGVAPHFGVTAQMQRDHFTRQLATYLCVPPFTCLDWSDAFAHLGRHLQTGDIVLFDEISWMGSEDPSFIPKLKVWWDKQSLPVMVFLCGSVSTWIEENILKSTAFFGRINLTMTLEPLPIADACQLLRATGFQGSTYDVYKLLSIFGGIPWYLEQMTSGETADDLVKQLCFQKDSLGVLEFDRIFQDLVKGKGSSYRKILACLKEGMKTLADVRKMTQWPHSGTLSRFMEHLITAGFVQKQTLWSFKTTKPLKQSLYHICDPYIRFYLKLIEPHRHKITLGGFQDARMSSLPGFEAHIGLQLEQLLLQNHQALHQAIGIHAEDIVASGPYRQSKTTVQSGCQIDYLVQTTTKNLYVCEFKFKRQEITADILAEVEKKVAALKVPRGFAVIPVLFHIGGVSAYVATSDYFYRIIDITDFLGE